ncbi:MAG: class I mannose-6-phosphate isomerase [Verrucomicrobia bacterium]|nr:class I mannose-6-phosphate isomerase [Verrucomicrobiota bacterium]
MLYPLKFQPTFKERVWGGRELERLYGKPLPAGVAIGESWEISDQGDNLSVIANGPLAGRTLRSVMEEHQEELLGDVPPMPNGRFPLLIKILDARQRLSLQVHPPANVAPALGGEPKTEMWYVAQADPGATIYAGLKRGVTRQQFEAALAQQKLEPLIHQLAPHAGDALFVPSGRLHAIGGGLVIFEIQQNSDTTYRVFDWGRPREIHVQQSLQCIDFNDFEPSFADTQGGEVLVACEQIVCARLRLDAPRHLDCNDAFHIIACVEGSVDIGDVALAAGEFALVPASIAHFTLRPRGKTTVLDVFA